MHVFSKMLRSNRIHFADELNIGKI